MSMSSKFNNQPRTIIMAHGQKAWRTFRKTMEDGTIEIWEKPYPTGGSRVLNVSADCRLSHTELLEAYGGRSFDSAGWKPRKKAINV